MSDVRHTHPGYFGVLLAIAGFYSYNGLGFLFYPETFKSDTAYTLLRHILPLELWGVLLASMGGFLFLTIFALPHRYVRLILVACIMVDVFWFLAFLYGQFIGQVHAFTLASAWGAFAFVEYRGLVEPEVNPMTDTTGR